jgi:hypothetical protein
MLCRKRLILPDEGARARQKSLTNIDQRRAQRDLNGDGHEWS